MYSISKLLKRYIVTLSITFMLAFSMQIWAEEQLIKFDIPAQPLDKAVTALAKQANLNIGVNSKLLKGKKSKAILGEYSVRQALDNILTGTDVTYRIENNSTVTLMALVEKNSSVQMKPITVKGELIARDLQDTQSSVAVITGEQLESRSDFDLYDVVERTPGIVSAFGEKGFSIRGIDQRGVGGGGTGLTVSTTVDGAIISNSNQLTFFGPYSTWDLEQIEVLRGPQSTQTGRNALAGAVVFRSKDPEYKKETKVRLEGGENDTYGGAIAFNTPLIEDKLAFRISAESLDTDGFVRNPTRDSDRYDAREQETLRAALRFDPVDNLDAIFKFTYAENKGGEDFVNFGPFPDSRINFSDNEAEEGSEIDSYNLRIGYDINPKLRVESETTYYEADYVRIEDSDNSPVPGGFLTRTADIDSFQQELKLLFDFNNFKGVFGAFYTDFSDDAPAGGTFDAGVFNPLVAGTGTITASIDQFQDTENYAFFGEIEYQTASNFRLIAGARYDNEETDVKTVNDFATTSPPLIGNLPPATIEETEGDFDAFLPKAGVIYDFSDDVSLGFTVQRGYRAGGVQVNIATGQRNEFDPEYTWNYEVAFRSQWMDRQLTLNANLFYTEWEDQQVNVQGPMGMNDINTENVGESTIYGGEIELQATPNDNLDLYTSLAFVNTEFDDFNSTAGDFAGNEFPFAPELTAAAGLTYYFDNGFFLSSDVSFTGEYYGDAANNSLLEVDSRTLVNTRLGYESDNWSIFAYARNLFNVDYYTQAATDNSGNNIAIVRSGEPRIIGFIAKINI